MLPKMPSIVCWVLINAHRILLLNEKRLVAVGTHQELLENNAYYRSLVASQQIIVPTDLAQSAS